MNRSEYVSRHQYCVTIGQVQHDLERTLRFNPQFEVKPHHRRGVCDHPEDGLCLGPAGADITDAQLTEIDERRAPKATPKSEKAAPTGPKKPLPEGLKRWLAAKKAQQ